MSDSPKPGGEQQGTAPGRPRNARSHAAILKATAELLAEIGYRAMTIEGIAARAGVGKTTVYRWWPSKGVLVVEAIREKLPLPSLAVTGDPRKDLHAAIKSTMSLFVDDTAGVALPALIADLLREPEAAGEVHALLQPRRDAALRILEEGVRDGLLPADMDGPLLLDLYMGTIHYRTLISGEKLTDAVVDQLTELLLDGVIPTV